MSDLAAGLCGDDRNSVVGEREDEGVETELVLQLEGASEAALAGPVGGEVDQELLTVPQCLHVRTAGKWRCLVCVCVCVYATMRLVHLAGIATLPTFSEREREREREREGGGGGGGVERVS